MCKKDVKLGTGMAPVPVVMVSCGNMEKSNITTVAWTGVVSSEPPLVYVSLRKTRYSYDLIKESKEFVINIPNAKIVKEVDFCGTKSGRFLDKFNESELTRIQADKVNCPMIKECPINIECKLKEIKVLGSHEMFIGEVVAIHADEEYVDRNGNIDFKNTELLTYLGQEYYSASTLVAKRGICLNKD